MASILQTMIGTVLVQPGLPLNPHSNSPGDYTYDSGGSSVILPASYSIATSFNASLSTSPATVTATLYLPANVTEVDGHMSLYLSDGKKTITSSVAFLSVQTKEPSSQTASSTTGSVFPTVTASTTSTSSTIPDSASISTTSSTSATVPTMTPSDLPKSQYTTREFAGVAIGCFLGGCLIASVLAFFCRGRLSRQRQNTPGSEKETSSLHGHGQAVYLNGSKTWEKRLPQSESDPTIRNLANRTLDQIELHVENYYQDAMAMPVNGIAKSNLQIFENEYLQRPMLQLIQQTDRPTVVIKHCVASLIISKITASSKYANSDSSFLPAEFMAVLPSSNAGEITGKLEILAQPTLLIGLLANNEAISKWRVLTSHLRPAPEHDLRYQQQRNQAIVEAAQQICQAFGPWARSNDNARHHNLINIMTRASEFGITLFAQPAAFEWQWSETATSEPHSKNASSQIAALPGLYKTTDQDCKPLAAPLHLLEPRMVTLKRRSL
jgi:hypothetical protein